MQRSAGQTAGILNIGLKRPSWFSGAEWFAGFRLDRLGSEKLKAAARRYLGGVTSRFPS